MSENKLVYNVAHYDDLHFSIDYIKRMFGLTKNSLRKEKIKRLFDEKTGKV